MKLSEALKEIYKQQDEIILKVIEKYKTTCQKGCCHCCYLLATISFADGILLAEHIFDNEDWKKWVDILAKHASTCCYEGMTQPNYFEKQIPCAFLDTENKLCKIYDIRPAACRYHYSADAPEKCSVEAPRDVTFALLNLVHFEEPIWQISMQITKGQPIGGPISLLTLFCMEFVSREEKEINSAIKKTISEYNLPDPINWLSKFGIEITGDLAKNDPEYVKSIMNIAKKMKETEEEKWN